MKSIQTLCYSIIDFCPRPTPSLFSGNRKIYHDLHGDNMQPTICAGAIPGGIPGALFKISVFSRWRSYKNQFSLTIVTNICRNVFLSGAVLSDCPHVIESHWMPNRRISRRQPLFAEHACVSLSIQVRFFSAALCLLFWNATVNLTINSLIFLPFLLQLVKINKMDNG